MPRHPGLALVTHRYDAESTAHLEALAAGAGVPARLAPVGHGAFGDVDAAVAALCARRCDAVTLVPLMTMSDSRTVRDVAALAHGLARGHGVAIAVASALDDAPEVVEILSDRARALAREAGAAAVVLVGHGPSDDADLGAWTRLGATLAEGVRERGRFDIVRAVVVRDDAQPDVRASAVSGLRDVILACGADTGRPVVVVPWLVGAGRLSRTKLRADMAELDVTFDGRPMLPHPAFDTWLARHLAVASMALTRAKPGSVVRLDER
jgi:sirohydrochlorin ferrochelatase